MRIITNMIGTEITQLITAASGGLPSAFTLVEARVPQLTARRVALVILLLWLYYSAQVFLLGAEFICLNAKRRCSRDVPDPHRERCSRKPVTNASRGRNAKR